MKGKLEVNYLHLEDLAPATRNARTHSSEQIAQLVASISAFGWTNPILIDEDRAIIAGHGRLEAAKAAGLSDVPTITLTGLSAAQKRALAIADNKLALNAGWDDELLRLELGELGLEGFDLSLIGFSDLELKDILADRTEGLTDPDDVPEVQAEAVSVLGDVWLLGRHRLVCGDCTDAGVVEAVLAGVKPQMVLTDPPYGMNLDADYTKLPEKAIRSKTYVRVVGDDVDFDPRPLIALFDNVPEQFWWGADWYYSRIPADGSWIVWDKRSEASDGLVGNHFEMLWSRQKHKRFMIRHLWSGFTARNKDSKRSHPTEKPVVVLQQLIADYSPVDSCVVDLFSGSGTTIIAAEMTGRICHAIEISPRYVDVAVRRWQAFTGQTATLERDGRAFADIETERRLVDAA
jgi:DNA modification methylase